MENKPHEILVFADARSREPFTTWFDGLGSREDKGRILTRIHRLELGNFGDCEPLGDGVNELRLFFGPGYRVYFGKAGKTVVILLGGGTKKTQRRDIAHAEELWKAYKGTP